MRTAVIPAQITSVEDRIAGNFNLTQIGLLIIAVFLSTAIFTLLPPGNQFAYYKVPIIGFTTIICIILAWRIKGKVVLNWLVILFRYYMRPKYYVFNKNDSYQREILEEDFDYSIEKDGAGDKAEEELPALKAEIILADLIRLESILNDPMKKVSYKVNKKGGLDVAVE